MSHVRGVGLMLGTRLPLREGMVGRATRRSYATEPLPQSSPPPPREPSTRTGTFYKSFGSPILKCFLGALFTYQVTYWAWLKLETLEEKKDVEDEIKSLKGELKNAILEQRALAKEIKRTEKGS
ncbi:hypothetical protein K505DRAFT_311144 [Melanomma pulvis-pyrius CBS 109.77]|uniref:Uncharacterized protein n=1 Tax=Melanomma pulvis-pyrius CBS 109.77 TaxID=1314802 RepID=A0A6A6X390_9PLEO|nr:hypothetical protein K505DRAFT_311144 [Melanomma pulvis-pyrius CBS 109.77]